MEILIAQIEALIQDLDRTIDLLKHPKIAQYTILIRAKFYSYINKTKDESAKLMSEVKAKSILIPAAWERFSELRMRGQTSFGQCLEVLGGIAIRHLQLEKGICDVAEALAREVYSGIGWGSVMILGDERPIDDLTENTQIIRLRFPELDIWSLALTAYEFGQLVARNKETGVGRDLKDFITAQETGIPALIAAASANELSKDFAECWQIHSRLPSFGKASAEEERALAEEKEFLSRQPTHIRTFFADMFAVYVLGPAYIFSRIHVLLIPDEMSRSGLYKPTLIRRFHFMLRTLKEMNEATKRDEYDAGVYSSEIKRFEEMLEEIKTALALDASEVAFGKPHEEWFAGLNERLKLHLEGFSQRQWEIAKSLSKELLEDSPKVAVGTDLPVVLNAAWLCRMQNPTRLPAIEDSTVRLCRSIGSVSTYTSGVSGQAPPTR